VGRPRENLPVLSDATLDALCEVEKPVPDVAWREMLVDKAVVLGAYRKGRYYLPEGIETSGASGRFFLFSRVVIAYPENYSVGLGLDAGEVEYRLVRCNGQHPEAHHNALEGTDIAPETRHVHRATARYLKARDLVHDGFAEVSDAYGTIAQALEHLSGLAALVPDGRILL
jgi:hypothetical protein